MGETDNGWFEISTAPKEGRIEVFGPEPRTGGIVYALWSFESGERETVSGGVWQARHWKPAGEALDPPEDLIRWQEACLLDMAEKGVLPSWIEIENLSPSLQTRMQALIPPGWKQK